MAMIFLRVFNYLVIFVFTITFFPYSSLAQGFYCPFPQKVERTWIGPDYWANRLQDWRVANGRLECVEGAKNKPMRTVHLLTHHLGSKWGDALIKARLGLLGEASPDAAGGFLIGAGGELDYRAAALIHHSWGPDAGIFAGIDAKGNLFIRDFTKKNAFFKRESNKERSVKDVQLRLRIHPKEKTYDLELTAYDMAANDHLGTIWAMDLAIPQVKGNIALVSHPGEGGRFWFDDFHVSGRKILSYDTRNCGPILSTQYTTDYKILKLTAQMMPLGKEDNQLVELQIKQGDEWVSVDFTKLLPDSYTAPFRVEEWDETQDVPYRVVYEYIINNDITKTYTFSGVIRHDPTEQTNISVAGFTGNHNMRKGAESAPFPWNQNGVWFPHTDIVESVLKQKPDLLFFSGDQVYEGASPTTADRQHIMADYLYKWYLWCWAFRDLTRNIPAVTIPDDHDVYQPNLWGNGGNACEKDDHGGYVHPPEFVRMVETTQASHLPDPYDPTPIKQDIGVYYTELNVGRVSFAVLEDRKFKSGCDGLIPDKEGRPDHIQEKENVEKVIGIPGLKLLGDRQLAFLRDWASDWRGDDFKVTLSQTIFCNAATHHGPGLDYLYADLDSNGWPPQRRDLALAEIRKGFGFMIGGDQHLATIIHHGIDTWNDAGWSVCTPSIANFYPRMFNPPQKPAKAYADLASFAGEYRDGFGNYMSMFAATNPDKDMGVEPKALHNRMPGYSIVRFDKRTREITMECWPRFVDPESEDAKQYAGWPKTIHQLDNYAREPMAYLPTFEVRGITNPVIQVIREETNEIVYTLRVNGMRFRPFVFAEGKYTVKIGEQGVGVMKERTAVQSVPKENSDKITVKF